jgi:hypothetical protein
MAAFNPAGIQEQIFRRAGDPLAEVKFKRADLSYDFSYDFPSVSGTIVHHRRASANRQSRRPCPTPSPNIGGGRACAPHGMAQGFWLSRSPVCLRLRAAAVVCCSEREALTEPVNATKEESNG